MPGCAGQSAGQNPYKCLISLTSAGCARLFTKLGVREDKFGILGRCNKISQWLSRSIRSNTCEHGFTYYSIEDRLLF